jgi:hypothetical protein
LASITQIAHQARISVGDGPAQEVLRQIQEDPEYAMAVGEAAIFSGGHFVHVFLSMCSLGIFQIVFETIPRWLFPLFFFKLLFCFLNHNCSISGPNGSVNQRLLDVMSAEFGLSRQSSKIHHIHYFIF